MNFAHLLWPLLIALALVLLITAVGARLAMWLRAREYLRERKNRKRVDPKMTGGETPASPAHLIDLAKLVSVDHNAAVGAQTEYARWVVQLFICLFIAFTSVALSATLFRENDAVRGVLAWSDIFALVWALVHLRQGKAANSRWLKARTRAELLRQCQFLYVFFPPQHEPRGITRFYDREAEQIEREIKSDNKRDLAASVLEFWRKRRSALEAPILSDQAWSAGIFEFYVTERARRQLRWFSTARSRLEASDLHRRVVLKLLYATTLALAAADTVLRIRQVPVEDVVNGISFLALMTTGFAAGMTGVYFSQNRRSLIHRYQSQERRISDWLEDTKLEDTKIVGVARPNIAYDVKGHILAFEDIMIEELVDWINISQRDSIEVGL